MNARLRIHWLERALLVVGLLLLAAWSQIYFESQGFQSAESRKLANARRAAGSGAGPSDSAAIGFSGPPEPGTAELLGAHAATLGRLEIPRLGISAIVAEGSDARTLRHAVGHIEFTARPGEPGNCALAGHRDTFLRRLRGVKVNDIVRMVTVQRTYEYVVRWTEVVEPQHVEVLDSTATRSLTLVTCFPFSFVGHAPRRFVVRAEEANAVASGSAR